MNAGRFFVFGVVWTLFLMVLPMTAARAAGATPDVREVFPGIWRIRFGRPEKQTPLSFRSAPPAKAALAALPSVPNVPLPVAAMAFRSAARGCALELPLEKDEKIYGLGLNPEVWEFSSKRAFIVPTDDPENNANASHAPQPFYVSSSGYGVYVDTARYASFFVGNVARRDKIDPKSIAANDRVADSTSELYRTRTLSDRMMLVDVPVASGVDVYVFAGPTPLAAVRRYNLFAGGGTVPPLWGLGIAYRGKGDFSAADIVALARSFRDDRIPCDIFGVEPGWQTKTYSCSFLWNTDRFPNPDAFLGTMRGLGYRMSFWEHPFTHTSSPIHEALRPFSGNYRVWDGLVPDFATPDARRIFLGLQNESLIAKGVESLKIDEVDHQPFAPNPWSFPDNSVFPSGLDGEQMHSLIGVLSQQTMLEPYRAKNRRTWGLVRNSHALAAPLPYVLYSDSYDHRGYLRGLTKSGFGGLLWVPEVRDCASVDDLVRRVQTVAFSPYAMINCWYMKLPPWQQIDRTKSNAGERMPDADRATALVRDVFELRMRLIPYLYATFADYRRTGTPPIQPLVLAFPDEPEMQSVDDQFLFGPSLLVAPMIAGQKSRSVTFPRGDWYDFYTGEKIAGGRRIEIEKPLEQMPLYVRANTLLPLAEPVPHVAPDTVFRLSVRAYGPNPVPCTLIEDDGESFDYEKGAQNTMTLTWNRTTGTGTVMRTGKYTGPPRYEVGKWTAFQ